jgi:uncharacterized protein YkwD
VLALVLACRPEEGADVSPNAIRRALRGIERRKLEIAPQGGWAGTYGAERPHELTPIEAAIAARVEHGGVPHLPALSRMLRELARVAPDRVNMPAGLVDGLMAWAGLPDPQPRLVVVELPDDRSRCDREARPACNEAITALLTELASVQDSGENPRFGIGVAKLPSGSTRMILGVLDRVVELDPLSQRFAAGAVFELRGRLVGKRNRPTVEIALPHNQLRTVVTRAGADGGFAAALACDAGDGAYQVEVLADGPHGPEVTANFPIYCGVPPPRTIVAEIEWVAPGVSPTDVALANFHFVNEARKLRGLPELQWDARAATVASTHGRDMLDHGFFGHHSPRTGDVQARFERAEIRATVVRENVARGYGPAGIHHSLMHSPGHRVNVLASDVTHVGIGVVIGEPESDTAGAPRPVFLTQNFFKPPGAGAPPPGQLVPGMRARVDARRRDQSVAAVRWDERLDPIADRIAQAHARGRPTPKGFEEDVFALGYGGVDTHIVASQDFDALANLALWGGELGPVGLGIVRGKDGGFTMVVLVAE